jgi:prolyl-tRNA editing enzyme YbaK/EbsC (Cys-tRNA(Pro) deacylase)
MNNFEQYLKEKNISDISLINSQEETHTAQQAADAHQVPVNNIVKSLVVKVDNDFEVFLVPGNKRLDLERVGGRMASTDEVKDITGYSIGGVPPFGHKRKLKINIEDGFDKNNILVAAGGKPNIVFKITFERLEELCTN